MKNILLLSAIGLSLVLASAVGAADSEKPEPEVRIIKRGDKTVEEYRINGNLYMIKITPVKGFPYYLIDSDGDGVLESRRNDIEPDFVIPRWTIFSW